MSMCWACCCATDECEGPDAPREALLQANLQAAAFLDAHARPRADAMLRQWQPLQALPQAHAFMRRALKLLEALQDLACDEHGRVIYVAHRQLQVVEGYLAILPPQHTCRPRFAAVQRRVLERYRALAHP